MEYTGARFASKPVVRGLNPRRLVAIDEHPPPGGRALSPWPARTEATARVVVCGLLAAYVALIAT